MPAKLAKSNASVSANGAAPHSLPDVRDLLAWYDRHARRLPWRVGPQERAKGVRPDPYRVWLSEIMLQQTTVKAVAPYFLRFVERWPTIRDLAAAEERDVMAAWAGLGYYSRARNLIACARAVAARPDARFPETAAELEKLPGIGVYTSAAIAAIACGEPAAVIDGNVERVIARLFTIETPLPAAKVLIRDHLQPLVPKERPGEFAEALMDLGATICTPQKPACVLCPWMEACSARRRGDQETFPRKAPKTTGTLRRGAAYVALRADGRVLLRTRAPSGLLGGMSEVPTSAWAQDFNVAIAPDLAPHFADANARWRRVPGVVTHTFTHFPLELVVYLTRLKRGVRALAGARWVPIRALDGEALPNVMRKVLAHALEAVPLPRSSPRKRGPGANKDQANSPD
jgi:A/G-specific adenine glycosylase